MGRKLGSQLRARGAIRWSLVAAVTAALFAIVLVATALDGSRHPTLRAEPEVLPTIAAPVADDRISVAFIGDSYTSGTKIDSGAEARWPALLAAELGFRQQMSTRGGVGYVRSTNSGVNYSVLATRITGNPDVIVVFGSRNDEAGYAAVRQAAARTYSTIVQTHPEAKLLIIGPPWVNDSPPAWLVEARDATRDEASAIGATYVDPLTENWFGSPGLIGDDGVNPTDAGHALIASKVLPTLRGLLPSSG